MVIYLVTNGCGPHAVFSVGKCMKRESWWDFKSTILYMLLQRFAQNASSGITFYTR